MPATNIVPKVDDEVLRNVEGEEDKIKVDELPAIAKAGLRLAVVVGIVIVLITILTFANLFIYSPEALTSSVWNNPNLFDKEESVRTVTEQATKTVIENHNLLRQKAWETSMAIFDLMIFKAFLPVFTTILGYIFGSRAISRAGS